MTYIKLFENDEQYQEFVNSEEYITPNICYINTTDTVMINDKITLLEFSISYLYDQRLQTYTGKYVEGMTWGQWCNSKYNTDGFYITNDGDIASDKYYIKKVYNSLAGTYVTSNDIITKGFLSGR